MASKRMVAGSLLGLGVLLSSVFLVLFYSKSFSPLFKAKEPDLLKSTKIIATVGKENLYEKDLAYELSVHPQKNDPKTKQILFEKMVNDSIILQASNDEGRIVLDPTIFNSTAIDYQKRIYTVESVKDLINSSTDTIEGYIVSIWFYNNGYIGPLGLQGGKVKAFQKMQDLHNQVLAKKITIQEAGKKIKDDSSLAQLDLAYKNNAIFSFKKMKGDSRPISLSSELNAFLWNAQIGEVSDVYLSNGVDEKTGQTHEALYYFGEVTNRKSGNVLSFDQWLEGKKGIYDVKYY